MLPLLVGAAFASTGTCEGPEVGDWVGDACLASTELRGFCGRIWGDCPDWDPGVFAASPWYSTWCAGGGHHASGTVLPEEPADVWFDADGRMVGAELDCSSACVAGCCDGHRAYTTRWGTPFVCVPVTGDTAPPPDTDVPDEDPPATDTGATAETGCGCGHAPSLGTPWIGVLAVLARRRRRP